MPKKRDSDYYEERLRKGHPAVYSDLRAGKHRSVRAAALAAGLIRRPTRLQALKREWNGASAADRIAFLKWVKSSVVRSATSGRLIATSDGRLLPHVVPVLSGWLKANRLRPGRIMKEIGGTNYNWKMSRAIFHGEPLPKPVLDKLAIWIRRKGLL